MATKTKLGLVVIALAACVAFLGCGKKDAATGDAGSTSSASESSAAAPAATDTAKAPAAAPVNIDYAAIDKEAPVGRAGIDAALAAKGKVLFTSKTCVACHAFGKKLIGPDMAPVADQRGAGWMKAQIQHPDLMTANDPISKQLMKESNNTQMVVPGGVTEDEARALIEYIRTGGK